MAKLITIYWRDIPAQVIGRAGRGKFKRELDPRFPKAIDRAAMRAGRGSSDAYLEDWRRADSESPPPKTQLVVVSAVAAITIRSRTCRIGASFLLGRASMSSLLANPVLPRDITQHLVDKVARGEVFIGFAL